MVKKVDQSMQISGEQINCKTYIDELNQIINTKPVSLTFSQYFHQKKIIMGTTCCKQQQNTNKIYSTKALMNMSNFNKMDFYFSTQNLSRLEGECLVVFSDRKLKLKNNNLSQILKKQQCVKIKEEITAYLDDNNISFDQMYQNKSKQPLQQHLNNVSDSSTKEEKDIQHILVNIDLPNIKFSKILVVLVEPWEGKASIKKALQKRIIVAMQEVLKKGVKEVAFVQFDEQLGIPVNYGAAILARSIFCLSHEFKIATICCKSIADQLTFLSFFENFKSEVTLSSYSRKSVRDSNYY